MWAGVRTGWRRGSAAGRSSASVTKRQDRDPPTGRTRPRPDHRTRQRRQDRSSGCQRPGNGNRDPHQHSAEQERGRSERELQRQANQEMGLERRTERCALGMRQPFGRLLEGECQWWEQQQPAGHPPASTSTAPPADREPPHDGDQHDRAEQAERQQPPVSGGPGCPEMPLGRLTSPRCLRHREARTDQQGANRVGSNRTGNDQRHRQQPRQPPSAGRCCRGRSERSARAVPPDGRQLVADPHPGSVTRLVLLGERVVIWNRWSGRQQEACTFRVTALPLRGILSGSPCARSARSWRRCASRLRVILRRSRITCTDGCAV